MNFVGHCLAVEIANDLVRRYRDLVASAVWISPASDISEVLKTAIKRGLGEGRLDPADLTTEQELGIDRFVRTPQSSFGRSEALFFLEMAVLMKDL